MAIDPRHSFFHICHYASESITTMIILDSDNVTWLDDIAGEGKFVINHYVTIQVFRLCRQFLRLLALDQCHNRLFLSVDLSMR
jgi:hypothetical protein